MKSKKLLLPFILTFLLTFSANIVQAQTPYGGIPWPIPGLIEIEDFDIGGEGVAYHDIDSTNNGTAGSNYRPYEGVDIEVTPDGSGSVYQIGWVKSGEWLKYSVSVSLTGSYTMTMRAAAVSSGTGGTIHLELDGVDITGPIDIIDGVWLGYSSIRVAGIFMNGGQHLLTLSMDTDATTGFVGNFNWMHFEITSPEQVIPPVTIQEPNQGSTFYVAPSGNDLNPGSLTQPWRSLAKAASTLTAGQAVYVRAGIYEEVLVPQNSGTEGNYIIYSAYPGESVVINGSGIEIPRLHGLVNINNKSYIRISGFQVFNGGAGVPDGHWNFGIATQRSDHIVIDHNYVAQIYSVGIEIGQFSSYVLLDSNEVAYTNVGSTDNEVALSVTWFSHHVEIRNNLVHDGFNEGINPVAGVHDVMVHHNTVSFMGRQGIYVDSWTEYQYNISYYSNVSHNNGLINGNGGFAISSEEGGMLQNVSFYNNIAYNNLGNGLIVTSWGSNSHRIDNVSLVNNTVYNNGQEGFLVQNDESTNILLRNNISYNNAGGDIVVIAGSVIQDHNLTSDPRFESAGEANFHLRPDSPAIDTGSAIGAPAVDFEGNTRPAGSGYDIGAYEFGSALTPSPPTNLRVVQ